MNSGSHTIYVEMIDGATCWAPTSATLIDNNKYLILDNRDFDRNDTTVLFEFIPGDIVEVVEYFFEGGYMGLLAKTLIKESNDPDRKLFEFLYKSTKKILSIDSDTRDSYSKEIQYVREKLSAGEFFYPAIVDTIKKFESV